MLTLPLSAQALAALAAAGSNSPTASARAATDRFHDVSKATAAGYGEFRDAAGATCIANGAVGAMGDHFANGGRLVDGGVIDAAAPEALVYERRNDGSYKLVALEYIVFKATGRRPGTARRRRCSGARSTSPPVRTGTACRRSTRCMPGSGSRTPAGCCSPGNPDVSCED